MEKSNGSWASVALLSMALLAACGKNEPPPPPKVEAPKVEAPAVNAELKRLAAEVYVYAVPMVLTDLTRADNADAQNTFRNRQTLPDATTKGGANPNADFLYSQAWLDLSHGPVILTVPDTHGRYYLVALLDAWTNVASSLGKRTSGTGKREFAIVGPRWKGTLPEGATEVRSPTEIAWLFGRTEVRGKADLAAAVKVQNQFQLASLGDRRKPGATPARAPAAAGTAGKAEPRDQVAAMDPAAFFTRFAMLLPGNPPAKDDAPMLAKMKQLGLEPGQPFDLAKRDEVSRRSIAEGVEQALTAIKAAANGSGSGDIVHGWRVDRALGRWGTEYGRRAVAAWTGLGLNAPEDAIFMATRLDSAGHPLDGANHYVLHFERNSLPTAEGFWSVSLYGDQHQFVANPLNRFNLGSNDRVKPNADGSYDIYLQNDDPGRDHEANWLPAPKGGFNVILRIYWPTQDVIDGRWLPPGINRAG